MRPVQTFVFFADDDEERWPHYFPPQFGGLRFMDSDLVVKELCLVADGDAPVSYGVTKIDKNGTTYDVYTVDIADHTASHVRVQGPSGVRAVRLKT